MSRPASDSRLGLLNEKRMRILRKGRVPLVKVMPYSGRHEVVPKAPEERPVPSTRTALDTSPVGAYCLRRTAKKG